MKFSFTASISSLVLFFFFFLVNVIARIVYSFGMYASVTFGSNSSISKNINLYSLINKYYLLHAPPTPAPGTWNAVSRNVRSYSKP